MLAGALYARGAMEAAERQYRAILSSRPHTPQIRAQLAEALLHQCRYAEAAQEAAAIAHDEPFAALACRIELWGRIAGGELEAARAVAAAAPGAGVPPAELEVFAAWLAIAEGRPEPRPLPVAAAPLLGVILETLVRARDVKSFELLLPLLERSALPPREQTELLATLYLGVGLLALAAQRWMAVCESEPDSRAFVGLARVAAANGQSEDMAVFAAEALRLDPANLAASQILATYTPATGAVPVAQP
jgi:tetratricopeptide (TPR) repeat protein